MKTAYHYAPETLLFVGTSHVHQVAGYDEYMLPQLATWVETPEFDQDTQQLKFSIDEQKWLVETKQIEVTAYHKFTHQEKKFDDISLLADEYTVAKPATQWDEWVNNAWVTNISNKYIADYDAVDNTRRALYREISDPLYMESYRKEKKGKLEEAAIFKAQADAAVEDIQTKHPFPIAPVT